MRALALLLLASCAPSQPATYPLGGWAEDTPVSYPRKVMAADGLEDALERALARWNEAAGERMLVAVSELGPDVSYVYVDPTVARSRTYPDHIELRAAWTHETLVHELGHHLLLGHGTGGCMDSVAEGCEITVESVAEALRIKGRHER